MKKELYQDEMKAIRLLQERGLMITKEHIGISEDILLMKSQLALLESNETYNNKEYTQLKQEYIESMSTSKNLDKIDIKSIYEEATLRYEDNISPSDILSTNELLEVETKINKHVDAFNKKYSLDRWDYAIACSCGLFAAMLDIFFVKAPARPTVDYSKQVDGVFNQWTQKAFNKAIPPELSEALSKANPIGAPDSSVTSNLMGAPKKALAPTNHRLRALSHDPIFGFIFGVLDMINGTCTIISEGTIKSFPSTKASPGGSIYQMAGRMLGHLLSDVNAPTGKGNRGMGLPAPFMGILRMFEGIPVGTSDFGKQVEFMYTRGYDFRQFITSSIPMTIMEVMLRAFYVIKQVKLYNLPFGKTMLDTMPTRINPRFRIMLAFAYGTSSTINAGKIYVTGNLLNANYASWMGLSWNGFHALKWVLLDRHLKLWEGIEESEIEELNEIVSKIEDLEKRALVLPT